MSYITSMKTRDAMRRFARMGVVLKPRGGGGSHFEATYQGRKTSFPVHPAKEMSHSLIRLICRQLGIDPKTVLGK